MSEIQQNRYDQLIRRVTGSVGPGSRVNETISELFPMIDVERVPAELLLLAGTQICMGGGMTAATAGEAGKAQLFNPADSGALVTLTDIRVAASGVTNVLWGRRDASFEAPTATEIFTDLRNVVAATPVAEVHDFSSAALASGVNQTRILPSTTLHISNKNEICVLPPGTGFEIGLEGTNINFFFGFNWRERVAEQSELNL